MAFEPNVNETASLRVRIADLTTRLAEAERERDAYRASFAKSRDDELSAAQEIDELLAKLAEAEQEKADTVLRMSTWEANTMHTCHEQCERPLCVANREIETLRAEVARLIREAISDASSIGLLDDDLKIETQARESAEARLVALREAYAEAIEDI